MRLLSLRGGGVLAEEPSPGNGRTAESCWTRSYVRRARDFHNLWVGGDSVGRVLCVSVQFSMHSYIHLFAAASLSIRYSLSRYSSCFNINTLGVRRLGVSCWAWKMWMTVRAALDKSSARWLMCIFRDGLVCLNEQQKHSLPAEGSQQQCVYI